MQVKDLTFSQLVALSQHWKRNPQDRPALALTFDASEQYIARMLSFFDSFERKRLDEAQPAPFPAPEIKAPPPPVTATPNNTMTLPTFPASRSPLWTDHLSLHIEDAMVIADVELPDYDADLMRLMVAMAVRHNIKTLIIGGDYWAFDSITPWPEVFTEGNGGILRDHLRLGETVIQKCREHFDEIFAVMGNHDRRFNKLLGGQLGPYDMMRLTARPIVKPYAHLYLETSRGRIMVVHPKNYSRNQLTVPTKLIASEEYRCHIVSTHTHHCAQGFDPSGRWQLVEAGCIRDPKRTQYKQENKTNHPQWVQGFAMIKGGFIRTFPKCGTDWALELGADLFASVGA